MAARQPASKGGDDALLIDALLAELGYDTPHARARAREVLHNAGLTRPGKQGIASSKRQRVELALSAAIIRVCGKKCEALARKSDARAPVIVAGATCELCAGSNNRRAALECARVMQENGVTRLLVLGGAPGVWHELTATLEPLGITIEIVDGTKRSHSQREAMQKMMRAQLMIVWGSTELRHAISSLYTEETPAGLRKITVARRSVEALCNAIIQSYTQAPGRRA